VSEPPVSWVVGAGGLLGSNVQRALTRRGPVWQPSTHLSWETPNIYGQLEIAAAQFATAVGERAWQVAWCAGAGVIATTENALREEATVLEVLLEALTAYLPPGSDGTAFLASSAGGVYAGADSAPFTEDTPVRPISPYGETKIRLEEAMTGWAATHGWRLVIGRISNLYGPGQNLVKPQGLISQLCRALLTRQPISIYVPLDTIRDYLYAPDCGELVADAVELAREEAAAGRVSTKILASQTGVTVGALLGELRQVGKRNPKVIHGTSTVARFQVRDLRFRSIVWPELDRRTLTPLAVGISATVSDLTSRLQAGSLRA
jgi:UDP-glucose 4-epimerase